MPITLRKKDLYAGLIMVLLGAGIALNSITYSLGTFALIGLGTFTLMLGVMMVIVGAMIFHRWTSALTRSSSRPRPDKKRYEAFDVGRHPKE